MHVLFGESLVTVFFFQDWLFWGTIGLTAAVAWRIAGWKAATIAALIGIYFKWYLFWLGTYAFRENLVVFLNAWLVFLVVKPGPVDRRRAALIGAVAGYNYVTDPINLLVMPVLIWFVYRSADDERRARSVQAFAAAAAIFFLLVPLRNLIVTGIPTVLPTEGAPTLWFGNRPPPGMLDNPGHDFYGAVWHYAMSDPTHLASVIVQKIAYSFGLYWTMAWATPDSTQLSLILLLTWICAALGVSFAWRQSRGTIVLAALITARWASLVVFIANHNVDRYEVALAMLLLPLAAVGLMLMWGWHRLLPALVVVALAIDHYTRISPEVGNYSAFSGARLLASSSYSLQRRNLDWRLPLDARVGWTFPADTALWMTPSVAVVEDQRSTFMAVRTDGLTLTSPVLAIPAPLVERLEIEAAFTGFVHVAHVSWQRKGMTAPARAWFKVDQTGRMKTYRIPVSRSGDWTGVIERLSIIYEGDVIAPARITLVTYPGVTPRPTAAAPAAAPTDGRRSPRNPGS